MRTEGLTTPTEEVHAQNLFSMTKSVSDAGDKGFKFTFFKLKQKAQVSVCLQEIFL